MIFDNHRPLPQYYERDPAEEQCAAMPRINPQSIGIPRRSFQSRILLGNPTILISGMQAST
jgi:hypothetical protein